MVIHAVRDFIDQGKDKFQEMIPFSSSSTVNPVIDLSRTKNSQVHVDSITRTD
jgi:hypothetical protein